MYNSKPVLLVEDDDVDVIAVQRAFKDLEITNQLVNTANGEEALEYLKGENNKKPCVILLDLNMPRMNGFEFLEIVKTDEALKKIPVVVLTTSTAEQDIAKSSELGVAGYMVKSVDYKEFMETIRTIDLYLSSSELSE
ncbi:MAG: response regulator [Planctomycetes bacterium]|nr:response regulator [Planctomycetota bacterium]